MLCLHTVVCLCFYFLDAQLMLVMELCTGGDMYARIPYTENQVSRAMRQVLSAVKYMHANHFIHRDVSEDYVGVCVPAVNSCAQLLNVSYWDCRSKWKTSFGKVLVPTRKSN